MKIHEIYFTKSLLITLQLMLRNGLIFPGAHGTFTTSPYLTRVVEKLQRLIDWQMQSLGAQKIIMPCIAAGQLWKTTSKYEFPNTA